MTLTASPVQHAPAGTAAWVAIVAAGVSAGLHLWKLPAALPLVQAEMGFSLLFAGVLLGVFQGAGILAGLPVSFLSELIGPRRILLAGMLFLVVGSVLGAVSTQTGVLLASRVLEGLGFILPAVVGPGLIRTHAPAASVNRAFGWWSSFQGIAILTGLIGSAFFLQVASWQALWLLMAGLSLVPVLLVLRCVPADVHTGSRRAAAGLKRIGVTVRSGRVWIAGLVFACYTVQWTAVLGFLPTIYEQGGLEGIGPGVLTAVVGGMNAVGALATGGLMQRGVPARMLINLGFGLMALAGVLTFALDWSWVSGGMAWQLLCIILFSGAGAMVPTTLTRLAVELVPAGGSASATMGLMQQVFNIGNFAGPVAIAWLATATGGWSATWWMTSGFAALGILLALALSERRLGLRLVHE